MLLPQIRIAVWLKKPEIDAGLGNCMFLSLTQQLVLLQMLVSNTFCPITHVDRKVNAMIIRNVAVDYIISNRLQVDIQVFKFNTITDSMEEVLIENLDFGIGKGGGV